MSVDQRLRQGLERIADDVSADAGPALAQVRARARRQTRLVRTAQIVVVAAAVAVGTAVAPAAVERVQQLAEPARPAASGVEGTYVVDVASSPEGRRAGLVGRWVITFEPAGLVRISPPDSYAGASGTAAYRVDGDLLRTDALVDVPGCQASGASVGVYRWVRDESTLHFIRVSDDCPARVALLTDQRWEVAS